MHTSEWVACVLVRTASVFVWSRYKDMKEEGAAVVLICHPAPEGK